MIYIIFLTVLVISIELIIKSNYFFLLNSLLQLSIKAKNIILNENISDHWKEKILPKYSFMMIKISLSMFLIFFLIISLFFLSGLFIEDFNNFLFSTRALISSILFGFFYLYLKKIIKK